jgi:hypothetical protein
MTRVASQIVDHQQDPPISGEMAGVRASPCIRRFATDDPDHARDIVRTCHSRISPYEPRTTRGSFRHARMQIALGPIMMTRSIFSHVRITAENDQSIILVLAERGWRSVQGRGAPVVSANGLSAVLVPRGRTQYENGPDSSGFVVSVPVSELARNFRCRAPTERRRARHDRSLHVRRAAVPLDPQFHPSPVHRARRLRPSEFECRLSGCAAGRACGAHPRWHAKARRPRPRCGAGAPGLRDDPGGRQRSAAVGRYCGNARRVVAPFAGRVPPPSEHDTAELSQGEPARARLSEAELRHSRRHCGQYRAGLRLHPSRRVCRSLSSPLRRMPVRYAAARATRELVNRHQAVRPWAVLLPTGYCSPPPSPQRTASDPPRRAGAR